MSAQENIQAIGEAVGEAWAMLFMKSATLSNPQISTIEDNPLAELMGEFVTCEIVFDGDVSGKMKLVVNKLDALTMVGMMLSMGSDDELIQTTRDSDSVNETELDALKEGFNQFSATAATVLRDKLSCSVNTSLNPVQTEELEANIPGYEETDHVANLTFELEGFDGSMMFIGIEDGLYQSLESGAGAAEAPATEEAAPAPAPAAAPGSVDQASIDKIKNLKVQGEVILASSEMKYTDVLNICVGSVIEFKKLCDAPVDLEFSNRIFANGEVVTTKEQQFALRIFEVAPPDYDD